MAYSAAAAAIVSAATGVANSISQKKMAKKALKDTNPFGPYRKQYGDQLAALMKDPSSITKDPGYEFQFSEGERAVDRSLAAKGYLGSGNEAIALTQYGQDYATNYLTQKENQLAYLAGAGISPNPAPGIQGYAAGVGTQGDALGSLGYGLQMLGPLFGGGGTTAGASSGAFVNPSGLGV